MPGRASELPRSEIDDDGRDGTFRGIIFFVLGFTRRGVLIGERWAPGAWWGPHTLAGRGPTLGRAQVGCGAHLAPPGTSFWLAPSSDVLRPPEKVFRQLGFR